MNIIMALLALSILIFIHELGHYWAARATGVRVEEFAIGFGPPIVKFKRNDIQYRLNLLPIGGYVKMLGEDNPDAVSAPDNFNNRPLAARFLVIIAGVVMNMIGAFIILALMINLYGSPTIKDIYVASVIPDSPAQAAGMKENDRLLAVNGLPIKTPTDFTNQIHENDGKPVTVTVQRDSQKVDLKVTPTHQGDNPATVGIHISGTQGFEKYGNFWKNTQAAAKQTSDLTVMTVDGFKQLVTGHVKLKDLSGPVGIIEITGEASQSGAPHYLFIMALLSVNLAVLNLVPIPGLDGGRLMFLIIEAIRRGKRIPMDKEASINLIGILFLLGLMVVVTFQDVFKLIAR